MHVANKRKTESALKPIGQHETLRHTQAIHSTSINEELTVYCKYCILQVLYQHLSLVGCHLIII